MLYMYVYVCVLYGISAEAIHMNGGFLASAGCQVHKVMVNISLASLPGSYSVAVGVSSWDITMVNHPISYVN